MADLTNTEHRIFERLASDGEAHTTKELMDLLNDNLAQSGTFYRHIYNLRNKIRQRGLNIRSETMDGITAYRLVRQMSSPYKG